MVRFMSAMLVLAISSIMVAEEKAKFDPKSLLSTWVITAGTNDGKKVEGESLKGDVIIEAGKITIKSPGETHVMSYKIDATKSPIQIDMEGLEGPAKGFKSEGIISLEKDELKLAYGFPGSKRPTKFESEKDSKVFLFVMKKK